MKTYIIEISGYPQEFIVASETRGEAILEAQKRWHERMNGVSIYETQVIEEIEHVTS